MSGAGIRTFTENEVGEDPTNTAMSAFCKTRRPGRKSPIDSFDQARFYIALLTTCLLPIGTELLTGIGAEELTTL